MLNGKAGDSVTVLWIILGLLGFIILLLSLPVLVDIKYHSDSETELTVKYLFIPIKLLPKADSAISKFKKLKKQSKANKHRRKIKYRNFMLKRRPTRWIYRREQELKKAAAERKRRKKAAKQSQKPNAAKGEQKKKKSAFGELLEQRGVGGMISWILELAKIAGGMFRRTFRGIIVRQLDLSVRVGGEDAAQTAINYGRWCAVLLPALSIILNEVRRYHRNIRIDPDFSNEGVKASLETKFLVFPIAVIGHALKAFLRIVFGEIKRQFSEKMAAARAQAQAARQ